MVKVLIIGFGGFLGAILRYFVVTHITSFIVKLSGPVSFPFGTLSVNIIGCFLIGIFGGLMEYRQLFPPEVRLFLFIGLLGGFTTYSTFGYEAMNLAREGQTMSMINYIMGHLVLGLLFVWTGHFISKYL